MLPYRVETVVSALKDMHPIPAIVTTQPSMGSTVTEVSL